MTFKSLINEAWIISTVVGQDTTPPTVSGCPDPLSFNVAMGTTAMVVTWTEPTVTDNSGVTPAITRSHMPGESFPLGTTMVLYSYTDMAGNVATCSFTITIGNSFCYLFLQVVVFSLSGGGLMLFNFFFCLFALHTVRHLRGEPQTESRKNKQCIYSPIARSVVLKRRNWTTLELSGNVSFILLIRSRLFPQMAEPCKERIAGLL